MPHKGSVEGYNKKNQWHHLQLLQSFVLNIPEQLNLVTPSTEVMHLKH
jgi:hypothetical protein